MITHTCLRDRVMLTFESTNRTTSANFSLNLQQIRRREPLAARSLRLICGCGFSESALFSMNRSGVIIAAFRRDVIRFFLPREVIHLGRAVTRMLVYLRGYGTEYEQAALGIFQNWGALLESLLSAPPTLQTVTEVLTRLTPRLRQGLAEGIKAYHLSEWPRARRNLLRDGVPAGLLELA